MNETKVSVPPGRIGAGMGNVPGSITKTDGQIKGFGAGKMDSSLEGSDSIGKGRSNGKAAIKGFSGSGVKGSKI